MACPHGRAHALFVSQIMLSCLPNTFKQTPPTPICLFRPPHSSNKRLARHHCATSMHSPLINLRKRPLSKVETNAVRLRLVVAFGIIAVEPMTGATVQCCLYAHGVPPLVAFVRVRFLDAHGVWPHASLVLAWLLSSRGFCPHPDIVLLRHSYARGVSPLAAFNRRRPFSSDGLLTRAAFVSWWRLDVRVVSLRAAIVFRRHLSERGF